MMQEDICFVSIDPVSIHYNILELWLNGITVEQALDYILFTCTKTPPIPNGASSAIKKPTNLAAPSAYGHHEMKTQVSKTPIIATIEQHTQKSTLNLASRMKNSPSLSSLHDDDIEKHVSSRQEAAQICKFYDAQLRTLALNFLLQQYQFFAYLEPALVNPYNFLNFSHVRLSYETKKNLIRSYYGLNIPIIREILKERKKKIILLNTLKGRLTKPIASALGIPEAPVWRQFDLLRKVMKWVGMTECGVRPLKQKFDEFNFQSDEYEGNSRKVEDDENESNSLDRKLEKDVKFIYTNMSLYDENWKSLGATLERQYFRICWLIHHEVQISTRRISVLPWENIELMLDTLFEKFKVQFLEVPSSVIEQSKGFKSFWRGMRHIEESKQSIISSYSVNMQCEVLVQPQFASNVLNFFTRHMDQHKLSYRLKSMVEFGSSFSSAQSMKMVLVWLVEFVDRCEASVELIDLIILSFEDRKFSDTSVAEFTVSCCNIAREVALAMKDFLRHS